MSEETLRWTIGAVRMTALVEAETSGIPPQFFFPDITPDDIRGVGWLGDDPGVADADNATMAMRVQAFVLEVGGRTVLVDPCVGNGKRRNLPFWNDLSTPWLERFHAAGFTEDGIDLVVHTHLHEDHIGWDTRLVDGEWVPTFPGARHLYVAAELDWAAAPEQQAREGSYLDSIEPVLRAGLADIVAPDADLDDPQLEELRVSLVASLAQHADWMILADGVPPEFAQTIGVRSRLLGAIHTAIRRAWDNAPSPAVAR